MLTNYYLCINSHDLSIGEGLRNEVHGLLVEIGLTIGGYDDRLVENHEIGIGGRQPLIVVIDGAGHGQTKESIGIAL